MLRFSKIYEILLCIGIYAIIEHAFVIFTSMPHILHLSLLNKLLGELIRMEFSQIMENFNPFTNKLFKPP
jgi:hypothetical protein